MDIFVTGASGFVGSTLARDLVSAGHTVRGLARSDEAAERVAATGATVVRGTLDDPAALAAVAAESDGVAHLAFDHSFTDMPAAARADLAVVNAVGDALAGSDKPFVVTSATGLVRAGAVLVESDRPDPEGRGATEAATLALADRGVRSVAVRLPQVHGAGDTSGFTGRTLAVARSAGVSAYVGDGTNRWPAVHVTDAARLYRLALEGVPAGTVLHAVGEEGVPFRALAEEFGRIAGVPVASVPASEAAERFGWLGVFVQLDNPTSSEVTRSLTGWAPSGPTLLEDLGAGVYA